MRAYNQSYMCSHDIDWFCKSDNKPVFVVSSGGIVPSAIKVRINRDIQQKVWKRQRELVGNRDIPFSPESLDENIVWCMEGIERVLRIEFGIETPSAEHILAIKRSVYPYVTLGFYCVYTLFEERHYKYCAVAKPNNDSQNHYAQELLNGMPSLDAICNDFVNAGFLQ